MRALAVLTSVVLAVAGSAVAAPAPSGSALLEGLGSADRAQIERSVAAILAPPGATSDPDALFVAARACEDKLLDPARALAIYERVVAEHPDARVSVAARRRIAALHGVLGSRGEAAVQAAALARLIARADVDPAEDVQRRGEALASAAWPGAGDAALWLAGWLRRSGRLVEAQAHYAAIAARWPGRPEALAALRGEIGCALDARDWPRAEALTARLPAPSAGERDELLADAARGRRRDRWHAAAWLAVVAGVAALLGSLVEALLRSPPGTRRAALRPPFELSFLGPVAAVLIGVAFTAHRLIAPAVATIAIGGLALSWLSGAALEQLRRRGRATRLRGLGHIAACLVGVAGLGYLGITYGGLLELLIETVRAGPG